MVRKHGEKKSEHKNDVRGEVKPELGGWTLQKFELSVDSGSERLYANGRQQVKVLVRLEAWKGLDPYTLTPDELHYLSLIEYNKPSGIEAPLPDVGTGDVTTGWGVSTEKNAYTYPRGALGDSEGRVEGTPGVHAYQYVEFWVQTAAAANSPLKIGAQIWDFTLVDGRRHFIATNDNASFDSSVTLVPVAVPLYNRQNLSVTPVSIEGDSSSEFGWDSVDYYSFSMLPQSEGGAFLSIQTPPRGIYMFAASPSDRGSCVGWANIGDPTVSYYDKSGMGHLRLINGYPEIGRATLVLVRMNKLPSTSNPPTGTDSITLRDEYGNDYRIPFGFGPTRSTLIFN